MARPPIPPPTGDTRSYNDRIAIPRKEAYLRQLMAGPRPLMTDTVAPVGHRRLGDVGGPVATREAPPANQALRQRLYDTIHGDEVEARDNPLHSDSEELEEGLGVLALPALPGQIRGLGRAVEAAPGALKSLYKAMGALKGNPAEAYQEAKTLPGLDPMGALGKEGWDDITNDITRSDRTLRNVMMDMPTQAPHMADMPTAGGAPSRQAHILERAAELESEWPTLTALGPPPPAMANSKLLDLFRREGTNSMRGAKR